LESENFKSARNHDELLDELLDSRRLRTEREHAAAHEIERLRELCDDLFSDLLAAGSVAPKDCGAYHLIQESIKTKRDRWIRKARPKTLKDKCTESFEKWFGFAVCTDMDIQTEVAYDNWREAWNTAIRHAGSVCNRISVDGRGITGPAHKLASYARDEVMKLECKVIK
jgi:hypothetical protein